jgi:hypothetical protein
MAKQKVIQNTFTGGGALDVYDRKYLKYLSEDFTDRASLNVLNSLRTKDIGTIEGCIKDILNNTSNFLMLIGLTCHIIERERLYEDTEFGYSYMRYADHLFDELNIPAATMNNAKT